MEVSTSNENYAFLLFNKQDFSLVLLAIFQHAGKTLSRSRVSSFLNIGCLIGMRQVTSLLRKGDVTSLSRTCRGRHHEVGIVEFGLYYLVCI